MGKKKSAEPAQSKAENFVNHQRRKYANEWDASSESLAGQAVYEWMAEQLGTTGFVLEIGAGTGGDVPLPVEPSRAAAPHS